MVNILGGHSICHSKQKIVYVHVSYCERLPRELFQCTVPNSLQKNTLRTVSDTGIYYSSDKVGTVYLA
jgi:hypothetical protein